MSVASAVNAAINDSATAPCDRLQSSCQRTTRPASKSVVCISSSGVSQTVSALGMRARSDPVRGAALLQREGEATAGGSARETSSTRVCLSAKGEHRLEQKHDVERAGRERRDLRDLEAAGKVAGARAGDADRARARVDSDVAAAELPRDEPTRSGDSAAQVEHGDAGRDARARRECPDLPGTHEALLLDVLARVVGRLPGLPQGMVERASLVLLHRLATNRCT